MPHGWHRLPPREYSTLDEKRVDPHTFNAMRRFANEGRWPIYIFGAVGTGKSFAAALAFVKWGKTAAMFRYADLIGRSMKLSKDGESGWYNDSGQYIEFTEPGWWKFLGQVDVLVVDEVGSGLSHDWKNELLWKVLEVRKGRPLVITSNLSLEDLRGKFDQRIESRIMAGSLIEVVGRDRRLDGIEDRVARIQPQGARS